MRTNTSLLNPIERVRQLEHGLGVAAGQVADLVADVGDDAVALGLDPGADRGLEIGGGGEVRALVGLQVELLPGRVADAAQVLLGGGALVLVAAGDEEDRDAELGRTLRQGQRRLDRRGGGQAVPGVVAAGAGGPAGAVEAAGRVRQEGEAVGDDVRPVRDAGLVDVEDQGELRPGAAVAARCSIRCSACWSTSASSTA